MTLDTNNKINIKRAIELLDMFIAKQETSEKTESWRRKAPPIHLLAKANEVSEYMDSLNKEGDLDEDLMKAFAQQVLWVLYHWHSELLSEVKEKHFKDL